MTPIFPCEGRLVRSVASERYPSNKVCSHPECAHDADDQHHIFARSQIAGDSYFVEITDPADGTVAVIPHVTGLCRAHHGDVEEHRAWIRLEEGVFNWYDRGPSFAVTENWAGIMVEHEVGGHNWHLVGPLNPQPGSVEHKPKRKKRAQQPARKKAVYSIRVPKDEAEDGYEVLDSLIDSVRDKYGPELGWTDTAPGYFVVVAALVKALQ
jgi:hypothetical protein